MGKELTYIPKIKLATDRIVTKAEAGGCYCFEGDIPMTEYCINDINILILTRNNGYLIVPHNSLDTLIQELKDILSDWIPMSEYFKIMEEMEAA